MKFTAVSRRRLFSSKGCRSSLFDVSRCLAVSLAATASVFAREPAVERENEQNELTTLTPLVEELKWLKAEKVYVYSVSKHAEDSFRAAAAVTVISNEDIRRSGVRTLPEALRLAPGVSVARINGNKSAVGVRGLSNVYSPQLLVLVDGRSIYQVNNSGVNWILEDYLLEDIERIEVVRGPGGTLWGANAVNGVINIVTKSASKTTGGYVSGGGGTHQRGFAYGRFGAPVGDWGWLRGYVKHQDRDEHEAGFDYQRMTQGGFRLDRETDDYSLTLAGDLMDTRYGDKILMANSTTIIGPNTPKTPAEYNAERGNVRANFTRTWSEDTVFQAQAYFDHSRDVSPTLGSVQLQDVYDVDTQMRFPVMDAWIGMVGAGYRYLPSSLNDHALWGWSPNDRRQQLFSAFLHNEVDLKEEELKLTLGTKLEHNDFTGWEVAPNARLAWTPNETHTVWASVSRAVQVPGRNQNDVRQPILPINQLYIPVNVSPPGNPPNFVNFPTYVSFSGSTAINAQELIGYELGYRARPMENLTVELSSYYNVYDSMLSGRANFSAITPGSTPGTLLLPSSVDNGGHGETYGFELATDYRPRSDLRLRASYSLFSGDLVHPVDGHYPDQLKDPKHQVMLWSQLDLPKDLELDVVGRWVSGIRGRFQSISGYFGLDVRLAWNATDDLEVALVGQNLIKPQHFEYVEDTGVRAEVTQVPRSGYLQLTYRF